MIVIKGRNHVERLFRARPANRPGHSREKWRRVFPGVEGKIRLPFQLDLNDDADGAVAILPPAPAGSEADLAERFYLCRVDRIGELKQRVAKAVDDVAGAATLMGPATIDRETGRGRHHRLGLGIGKNEKVIESSAQPSFLSSSPIGSPSGSISVRIARDIRRGRSITVRHSTLVGFVALIALALAGASSLAIIAGQRAGDSPSLPDHVGEGIDGYRQVGTIGGPMIPTTPVDVAIDDAGRIFVADIGLNRVLAFTPEGGLDSGWGDNGMSERLIFPTGIALGHDGSLYVLQLGESRVHVLDDNGRVSDVWSVGAEDLAGPGIPSAIGADSQGTIYIPDQRSQQINRISSSGEELEPWLFPADEMGSDRAWPRDIVEWDGLMVMSYATPGGESDGFVAFTSTGDVAGLPEPFATAPAIEDLAPGSVAVSPDGGAMVAYLSDEPGVAPALWDGAESWAPRGIETLTPINGLIVPGIAVDRFGRLFLADPGRQQVRIYNANRTIAGDLRSSTAAGLMAGLDEISVGRNGLLYAADPLLGRVVSYGPDGNVQTIFELPENPDAPLSTGFTRQRMRVAVDPAGLVYVVDEFTGTITAFRQDGVVVDPDWAKSSEERPVLTALLAAGEDERLYVVEVGFQDLLRVFDGSGNDLGLLTESSWESAIQDVIVAGDRLYTVDLGLGTSSVRSVSTNGGDLDQLADLSRGEGNENRTGFALAIEPDGSLLIGAVNVAGGPEFEYQLLRLDTSGNLRRIGTLDVPFTTLPDITVSPTGALYIAAPNDQQIYVYEPEPREP